MSAGSMDQASACGAASDAEAISNAQWRGMQALAVVCLGLGTGSDRMSRPSAGRNPSLLSAQLRWLTATDTQEASTVLYAQQAHTVAHHA